MLKTLIFEKVGNFALILIVLIVLVQYPLKTVALASTEFSCNFGETSSMSSSIFSNLLDDNTKLTLDDFGNIIKFKSLGCLEVQNLTSWTTGIKIICLGKDNSSISLVFSKNNTILEKKLKKIGDEWLSKTTSCTKTSK